MPGAQWKLCCVRTGLCTISGAHLTRDMRWQCWSCMMLHRETCLSHMSCLAQTTPHSPLLFLRPWRYVLGSVECVRQGVIMTVSFCVCVCEACTHDAWSLSSSMRFIHVCDGACVCSLAESCFQAQGLKLMPIHQVRCALKSCVKNQT